jgi:hypothetical protein
MPQRVRLDHPGRALYLALVLLAGCAKGPGAVVPEVIEPVALDSVAVWSGVGAPAGRVTHRFKWLYRDDRSSVGGRGSARIAAPDSLRFDVAGPLGASPAAAMVVGDSAVWIEAPDAIKEIVPSYPLFWAGFGVVRPPLGATAVWAGQAGTIGAWKMVAGADTVTFALDRGTPMRLKAELRRGGAVVARMDTELAAPGHPTKATLLVPGRPARLDLTFTLSDPTARFPSDVWRPRRP